LTSQNGTVSANRFVLSSYAPNSSVVADSVTIADNTSTAHNSLTLAGGKLVVNRESLHARVAYTPAGTTFGSPAFPGGYVVKTESIAAGHDDIIHGFGYDSVQSRMYLSTARANLGSGDGFDYVSSTAYGRVYDSAIVVAPEPGTILALGAGVGVLLRRRRKQAQ
jgi:hypothetical protein